MILTDKPERSEEIYFTFVLYSNRNLSPVCQDKFKDFLKVTLNIAGNIFAKIFSPMTTISITYKMRPNNNFSSICESATSELKENRDKTNQSNSVTRPLSK